MFLESRCQGNDTRLDEVWAMFSNDSEPLEYLGMSLQTHDKDDEAKDVSRHIVGFEFLHRIVAKSRGNRDPLTVHSFTLFTQPTPKRLIRHCV